MLPCNVANFMPRVYIENFNNEWQPPQRYDAIKKLALSLLETTLTDVHRLATDGKKKDDADNLRANFATPRPGTSARDFWAVNAQKAQTEQGKECFDPGQWQCHQSSECG